MLDWKTGDVNGDGVLDTVYLYGQVDGPPGIFADNITLVIQDGRSNKSTTVHLKNNAGYNARLFLGDFNKDTVPDIMVSIDTGGVGDMASFISIPSEIIVYMNCLTLITIMKNTHSK